jgi:hypothetical protein
MEASIRHERRFCCSKCKDRYNNRRKERGMLLYDLFMAMRYDRGTARLKGVWAIMCRMASDWKAEDDELGIKSFTPVNEVLQRNTKYVAVSSAIGFSRRGR